MILSHDRSIFSDLRVKLLLPLLPFVIMAIGFNIYLISREFILVTVNPDFDNQSFLEHWRLLQQSSVWPNYKRLVFGQLLVLFLAIFMFYAAFEEVVNRPLMFFRNALNRYRKKKKGDDIAALLTAMESDDEIGYVITEFNHLMLQLDELANLKNEFLSVCSHDLKSPVGMILTVTSMLLDGHFDPLTDAQKDVVNRMRDRSRDSLQLISDLLDMGKLESGLQLDFQEFIIDDMLNKCLTKAKDSVLNRSISVSLFYDQKEVTVFADPNRLEQVLDNLLGNAIKYVADPGGEIELRAIIIDGKAKVDAKTKKSNATKSNPQELLISVHDNGKGIPEDRREAIFKRYEQASASDAQIGTGLGLAICQMIVELHKGVIWVDSQEGHHTEFFVRLPILP